MIRSALIVGAGIAGLSCARTLDQAGVAVTILDKGRRPGGRVATRRTDGLTFNHGAQFFTARGEAFKAMLVEMQTASWVEAGTDRLVALPNMSALPATMALGLEDRLATERHAAFLHAQGSGWSVRHFPSAAMKPGQTAETGGDVTPLHDAVLIAVPASQAAALLETACHPFGATADRAVIAPCWAVMARFPAAVAAAAVIEGDPVIAWAARESSRPGRGDEPEAWTLHASTEWSRVHIEASADAVCQALVAEFRRMTGAPEPDWVRAHRWRHAKVETPIGEPCLWDPDARIGACGDWLLAGRVEAAFDSGLALATRVLGSG